MIPLIPSTYLGPISYFAVLAQNPKVYLETKEHFVKQSYRNRARIYGANGTLNLTIPLNRKSRERKLITDTSIANEEKWQHHHWKSITSAYRCSPYFEFYEDHFVGFFLQEQNDLFKFNHDLTQLIIKLIGIDCELIPTENFEKNYPSEMDLRSFFSHKNPTDNKRYIQVFEDRCGFLPDLSIIDLLFNLGPESLSYLKKHELTKQLPK